jgi:hypothetical protein
VTSGSDLDISAAPKSREGVQEGGLSGAYCTTMEVQRFCLSSID